MIFSPVTRIERLPCPVCSCDVLAAVCFVGQARTKARAACPWCSAELDVGHLEPEVAA